MAKNKKQDKELARIIAMQDMTDAINGNKISSIGKGTPTSMAKLITELNKHKIPYDKQEHPGALERSTDGRSVIDILGYSPAGLWHITIKHDTRTFSVIRGLASFGMYEVYKIEGRRAGNGKKAGWAEEPERYSKPDELVADFIRDSFK